MNNIEHAADDSWSSLARELGLGEEPVIPAPVPEQLPLQEIERHLSELPNADDGEDTALEPGLHSDASAESGEGAEGDDAGDDGKRRRRRRRRRRKGGSSESAVEPRNETDEPTDDDQEPFAPAETSADLAMRDVVANWNVPSWDELISGLYRPGH